MLRKRTNDRSTYRQTSSILWQKCTNLRALKQMHASMLVHGFNSDISSLREFIFAAAVSISSTIDYAHQVFDYITQPDIFMWNSLIRGSAMSGNPSNALLLYRRMEKRHVSPDRFTFPYLFKACTKLSCVNLGFGFHGKVSKSGFELNNYIRNALINFHSNVGDLSVARALFDDSAKDVVAWSAMASGYARRGNLEAARKVFDEMPERDLFSWNVMITGYAKRGDMETARRLFYEAPKRDAVTWNVMIAGYVSSRAYSLALEAFEEMRIAGVKPDEVTMISVISACTELNNPKLGTNLHERISPMAGSDGSSILLSNALINMYSKCGSIEKALRVFDKTPRKDVTTWNSMIIGLALHGHTEQALDLFETMLTLQTIRPDEITFVAVLVACSHAGRVEEGRFYFDLMRTKFKIKPNLKHYCCMVDVLGRAGMLSEAFGFIERMEVEPNAVVWRSLLAACRVHGDAELGRITSERLRILKGGESGDFVLLSSIYASRGEWDGAERVRKAMDEFGVVKEAGFSVIETDSNQIKAILLDQ